MGKKDEVAISKKGHSVLLNQKYHNQIETTRDQTITCL